MTEVFVKRGLQKCKLWRVETEFADCYCCISGPSSCPSVLATVWLYLH